MTNTSQDERDDQLAKEWATQKAETDLLWVEGSVYPVAVICTVYKENRRGEKLLVEEKTLKLVETGS